MLTSINRRFGAAKVSGSLEEAGVLMHNFDGDERGRESPWAPCEIGQWCERYRDRVPTSLVYPGRTSLFTDGNGGFVVNPSHARMLCSFSYDGHSEAKTCEEEEVQSGRCIPGCGLGLDDCDEYSNGRATTAWCSCGTRATFCAYRPTELPEMLRQHRAVGVDPRRAYFRLQKGYNEVVLDADAWERSLPASIEAVYVLSVSTEQHVAHARDVRRSFDAAFGRPPLTTPLLLFDPDSSPRTPFVLMDPVDD